MTWQKFLHSQKFRRKIENSQKHDFWAFFDQYWGLDSKYRHYIEVGDTLNHFWAFWNKGCWFRPLLDEIRPYFDWYHMWPDFGRKTAGNQNFWKIFCASESWGSGLSHAPSIKFISQKAAILVQIRLQKFKSEISPEISDSHFTPKWTISG